MKLKFYAKFVFVICLCVVCLSTFTACKDEKTIYAEETNTNSQPDSEYWKDTSEPDDIYVPADPNDTDGETPNFSDDDVVSPSDKIDTDSDAVPNNKDTDIDGDKIPNEKDDDVDGDSIPNDKDDDIDGDTILNQDDTTPSGPSSQDKTESDNNKTESDNTPSNNDDYESPLVIF